jgi:hypothetical protein
LVENAVVYKLAKTKYLFIADVNARVYHIDSALYAEAKAAVLRNFNFSHGFFP